MNAKEFVDSNPGGWGRENVFLLDNAGLDQLHAARQAEGPQVIQMPAITHRTEYARRGICQIAGNTDCA